MTDEELIARLRGDMPEMRPNRCLGWREDIDLVAVEAERKEAADRIEQLVATNEALVRKLAWAEAKLEAEELTNGLKLNEAEARAERLEEALIWCSGSADFNEGGFAREGWLKLCAPLLKGADHD